MIRQEALATSLVVALVAAMSSRLVTARRRHPRRSRKTTLGIIPARYESTRFPGKPLVDIKGKAMVVRTWEQAKKATSLDHVVVATDDDRIADVCRQAGAEVVMTSRSCPNGTERCNEAASKLPQAYDIVINIQGDEPLMEPGIIDACVNALKSSPDAVYSTACTPLAMTEVHLAQRVKVVLDRNKYALYFSRGILPSNRAGQATMFPAPFEDEPYLLHLGIACFDRQFLQLYSTLPATPLMLMEDLEQLKVIENGYKIKVVTVDHVAHGVDEPSDVDSVIRVMEALGLS